MIDHLEDFYDQLEKTWVKFSKILKKYEDVFPPEFNNKDLFLNVYALVCSRCYSGTSLIPMAD